MRQAKYLLANAEIAERAGLTNLRPHTADGKVILYEGDMKLIHLEPEEYATGIQGLQVITEAEAHQLALPMTVPEEPAPADNTASAESVATEGEQVPEEGPTPAEENTPADDPAPGEDASPAEDTADADVTDTDNTTDEEEIDNGTD